jgi:hypothetical protein
MKNEMSPLAAKLLARLRAIDTTKLEAFGEVAMREHRDVLAIAMSALKNGDISAQEAEAINNEASRLRRELGAHSWAMKGPRSKAK